MLATLRLAIMALTVTHWWLTRAQAEGWRGDNGG
jgi:hypothetical protein